MESEDEQEEAGVSLKQMPGRVVYSKHTEIPGAALDAAHELIKVGVIVSVDESIKGRAIEQMAEAQTQIIRALALPDNVHISDLPENMTLETEVYKTENRTTMRMRIKPEPNTLLTPAALRFNLQCHYMTDESEEEMSDSDQLALTDAGEADGPKGFSPGGKETEHFYDVDAEEMNPNEKGVQTDIALGELLFSDSIASVPSSEAENVGVQTYITAVNASEKGEEGVEQGYDTVEGDSIGKQEEDEGCACEEEEEKEEEGEEEEEEEEEGEADGGADEKEHDDSDDDEDDDEFCACEEELKDEEETEQEEDTFCACEEEEAADSIKEAATEGPQEALEEETYDMSISEVFAEDMDATTTEIPSGVPLCLLRGDPPWVDPPLDTYTVMWDTNLEVTPKEVSTQFKDIIDPMLSDIKVPDVDPLQQMRRSGVLSGSFTVKIVSSDQSYFGGIMAGSSDLMLKRDPELFNIHIDLNTWGFPASLHERYAISATASIATLYDKEPSLGELLYMTGDDSSMHSIYNPADIADFDRADTMSVGFIIEDGKAPPDIIPRSPVTQSLEFAPLMEMPMVPEDTRTPDKCNEVGESSKGPRSISEQLQSPISFSHSSSGDLEKYEDEFKPDTTTGTEKQSFELQWQEGLPAPQSVSPHKVDTLCFPTVNKTESEINPSTGKDARKRFEEATVPHTSEGIKHDSRCKCKRSPLEYLSHSTPRTTYGNSASKFKYGVLTKALKDFEQQILPLHKALDDIKCKIQSLEVEHPDKSLSPVCSEDSSVLSQSDSGYEQSAQTEAMAAKFPCIQNTFCVHRISSSPQIPCVCDSAAESVTPRRRKPCLRTNTCPMNRYMMPQRAAIVPLDMGITYLMPTPVEMITPAIWPHSSVYGIPSELGCPGACFPPSSGSIVYQHLSPKKMQTTCCRRTNEY